jgi:hypothetical protein
MGIPWTWNDSTIPYAIMTSILMGILGGGIGLLGSTPRKVNSQPITEAEHKLRWRKVFGVWLGVGGILGGSALAALLLLEPLKFLLQGEMATLSLIAVVVGSLGISGIIVFLLIYRPSHNEP